MMKITLNRKMIVGASCLLLVACAGETHAQQETPVKSKVEDKVSLTEQCKELSEGTTKKYQVMSGQVGKVGIVPRSTADCFEGGCPELSKTSFYALMNETNVKGLDSDFVVYTEKEEREELVNKKPYMQEGKNFSFCATEIEGSREHHEGKRAFNIISRTIHEITQQKRPYHLDILEHMKDSPAYPGLDKEYEEQLKNWEMQKGGENGQR